MPDLYGGNQFPIPQQHGTWGPSEPYPPPNKDEQRLTAILERIERRLERIEAAMNAGD